MRKTLGFVALSGLLLAVDARAGDEGKMRENVGQTPPESSTVEAPAGGKSAPAVPGVLVGIDPQSGQLRAPTAGERRALMESARRSLALTLAPSSVVTLRDGRRVARLGPEHFRWSLVTRTSNGTLGFDCVSSGAVLDASPGTSGPVPDER